MLLFFYVSGFFLSFLLAEILLMTQLRIIFYIHTFIITSFNATVMFLFSIFLDDERWMMRKIVLTCLFLD